MTAFIGDFQNKQIHRNRKQISGCQGLRGKGKGEWLLMSTGLLCGLMKMFWNKKAVIAAQLVNRLKTNELYTFKGWTLCYVDYPNKAAIKNKKPGNKNSKAHKFLGLILGTGQNCRTDKGMVSKCSENTLVTTMSKSDFSNSDSSQMIFLILSAKEIRGRIFF